MQTQRATLAPPDAVANGCPPPPPATLRYKHIPSPFSSLPSPSPYLCISELTCALQRIDEQRSDRNKATLKLIERLGCGYAVVDQHQEILTLNAAAQRIIDRANGRTADGPAQSRRVLHELVDRACGRLSAGALIWIAVSSRHAVNVALDRIEDFTADRISIVVLLDLDVLPAPNPATLKRLFGLTFAEARLALHLAQGSTPDDIAKILRVSRTTIRSQLAAIFSKTHTKRQAALVALLGRIAVLP